MYTFLQQANKQSGAAALISTVFFLIISLVIISGFVFLGVSQARIARDLVSSKQALAAAESGLEEAALQLANDETPSVFEIEYTNGSIIPVTFSFVGDPQGTEYRAVATQHSVVRRMSFVDTSISINIDQAAFAGEYGILLENRSRISNGGVYANGPIESTSNNTEVSDIFFQSDDARIISRESINNIFTINPSGNQCNLNPVVIAPTIVDGEIHDYPVACSSNSGANLECGAANCPDESFSLGEYGANLKEDPNVQEFENIRNVLSNTACSDSSDITNQDHREMGGCVATPSGGEFNVKNQGRLFLTGNLYVDGDIALEDSCEVIAVGDHRILIASGKINIKNTCHATGFGGDNEPSLQDASEEYVGPQFGDEPEDRKDEYDEDYGEITSGQRFGKLVIVAFGEDDDEEDPNPNEVAFRIQGGANSPDVSVVYAPNGTVLLQNNSVARGAFGKRVWLRDNAELFYNDYLGAFIEESTGILIDWGEVE